MNATTKPDKAVSEAVPANLNGFDTFEDFLKYTRTIFDLQADEYVALFNVLLKLQVLGEDPIETMRDCRTKMASHDCMDMLRFMIYVDGLDLAEAAKTIGP